jgi:multicomponent Na+:H+ antiporter subunit D
MSHLVALPVLLPLGTALALLFTRSRAERLITLASGALLLCGVLWIARLVAAGAILVLPLGGWPPGIGIVWVVDRLSAGMLVVTAIVSLAVLVYLPGGLAERERHRLVSPVHQLLVAGINGAFVTGDLFNLFVFFEVMLLGSFVLVLLGGRGEQLRRGFPYVLVSLVASALHLAGVGMVYATAGTVNLAQLSLRLAEGGLPATFWGALVLVLVVYGIKAALVPLFFWLPDAYPAAPIPVSALLGGLLTKVGVYALFRVVPLIGPPQAALLDRSLLVLAAATMLVGVLGALGRGGIREILSFHVVSQIGYMIFGLALRSRVGLAAGFLFILHNVLVKTALFLAGGIAERIGGSGRLDAVHGVARSHPWAALAFFAPALALAGIPPWSGFFGKLFLLIAGFRAGAYAATGIALLVSLFTFASMLKIWVKVYWGEPEGQAHPDRGRDGRMLGATLALGVLSLAFGVLAPPLYAYAEEAAAELLERTPYRDAVLGVARSTRAP